MLDINVKEIVDKTLLQRMLNSFALATNLGVTVVDKNGDILLSSEQYPGICGFCELIRSQEEGLRRCKESAAKGGELSSKLGEPYIFRCHAGLIEWAAPILLDDKYYGAFLCGQVLMWDLDDIAIKELISRNEDLSIERRELESAARELQVISGPNVQAASELLFVISNHIMKITMVALMQRRELNQYQAKLAEEIYARKRADEALRELSKRKSQPIYPLEKEKELLGKVKIGDRTGAKEILNDLLGAILLDNLGRPEVMKARILELMVVLSRAAVEAGASLEKLLGLNYQYVQEFADIEPLQVHDISAWIVKVLDKFMDIVYNVRNEKKFGLVEKAISYIGNTYSDLDLSLDSVAEELYISPYYLSHVFKDELGMTFIEFLTKVRLEEAKKLLRNGNQNMIEIAEKVGYANSSYFSKVFKKHEGVTPTNYKAQKR